MDITFVIAMMARRVAKATLQLGQRRNTGHYDWLRGQLTGYRHGLWVLRQVVPVAVWREAVRDGIRQGTAEGA